MTRSFSEVPGGPDAAVELTLGKAEAALPPHAVLRYDVPWQEGAAGWEARSALSADGAPPASLEPSEGSGRAYAPRSAA